MKALAVVLALLLGGCSVYPKESTAIEAISIERECSVSTKHLGRTKGDTNERAVESVRVDPDCTTTVSYEEQVGEDG